MDTDLGHFQQQQEEQMQNHFAELAAIDCSKYVEKKGELSYLMPPLFVILIHQSGLVSTPVAHRIISAATITIAARTILVPM